MSVHSVHLSAQSKSDFYCRWTNNKRTTPNKYVECVCFRKHLYNCTLNSALHCCQHWVFFANFLVFVKFYVSCNLPYLDITATVSQWRSVKPSNQRYPRLSSHYTLKEPKSDFFTLMWPKQIGFIQTVIWATFICGPISNLYPISDVMRHIGSDYVHYLLTNFAWLLSAHSQMHTPNTLLRKWCNLLSLKEQQTWQVHVSNVNVCATPTWRDKKMIK